MPCSDGLDQVARLQPRLPRVAADERSPLEDDVVQLARPLVVRPDRADERAFAKPLAAEDRVARGRRRDDDVLAAGVAVRLALLGANPPAELLEPLLRPAVDDDVLDRRHRLADALHLALGLPAAAEDAERRDAGSSEELRGDAARGAGRAGRACPPRSRRRLGALEVEQADDERRPARKPRVGLQAGEAEAAVTADMTANAPPSRRCR